MIDWILVHAARYNEPAVLGHSHIRYRRCIVRPLFLAIGLGYLGAILGAGAAKAEDRSFLVFPVKTELQRTAMGMDKNTRACVLVSSDALRREDNALHWTSFDFDALRASLSPHKEGKEAGVTFYIYHQVKPDK